MHKLTVLRKMKAEGSLWMQGVERKDGRSRKYSYLHGGVLQ
jgi:hypothetical protein